MAIKENALPLGASSGSGSYIRTVSSGGESQRTSFDVVKGAMNADIETALENEVSAREDADTALSGEIADAVAAEVTARNQAIAEAIATEVTDRNAAIAEAQDETEQAISTAISGEVTARNQAIASAIQTETADRTAAIQEAIADEVTDRNAAIASAIDDEETARNTAISEAVEAEAQAREAADEELNQSKANTDGNYPDMTVGNADQLLSSIYTEDQIPYNFRQSGGGISIGDREIDKIVGGTIAWNQLCPELNESNWSGSNTTRTYSDGVATIVPSALYGIISKSGLHSGVKVISPSHKYLMMADVKAVSDTTLAFVIGDNTNFTYAKDFTATTSWAKYSSIINIASTSVANAIYYGIRSSYSANLAEYQLKNFVMFDLTQMFGSTIADYIYSLEQATAGAGVAYFRKLFPKPYYAYNAGELMSVQAASHEMVGFNQWDEVWENGRIAVATGANISGDGVRATNYIPVIPSASYHAVCGAYTGATSMLLFYYDADKNFISYETKYPLSGFDFTPPDNAHYLRFNVQASAAVTYNNDICINLAHNGSRNGEYEPYEKHSYELDSGLTLRGIPRLDSSNSLYYDGDEYESDGSVTRKYLPLTLNGTEAWVIEASTAGLYYRFYIPLPEMARFTNYIGKFINDKGYPVATGHADYNTDYGDIALSAYNVASLSPGQNWFYILINKTGSIAVSSVAELKEWLASKPITILYPLATPTEETAAPYTNPQTVSDWGTEEYVDAAAQEGDRDVAVPVGHVTDYLANLRDKLQNLPDAANADGTYLVQQTSGQMALLAYTPGVNIPAAPTTDGTYTLQAVVSGGVATYSWVSS